MSLRTCGQCAATTRRGDQCKNRTCVVGPYCWIHTKIDEGFVVKKSTIPNAGKGLFAAEDFAKGEEIGQYRGEMITKQQADLIPDEQGAYILCHINQCVDARRTNSTPLRYMNDPRGTRKQPNARFVASNRFAVRTTKKIKKGDEILVKYGGDYWENRR